ncbi:MAG TPA: hypothetical protein VIR03_02165 [Candidatus Saccharimonadales bacterium]
MPNDIALIVALVLPVIILTVLRINAAMVFLSLCLGYVLVQFVANDTDSLISFVAPNHNSVSASTLRLVMFLIPIVLTSLIMIFSVKGRAKLAFNALPAAGVSVLALLMAVPMMTPGLRSAVQAQSVWWSIAKAQALIVGASAMVSLLFLWMQRKGSHKAEGKHHH